MKSRANLDKSCTLTPKLFFRAAAQLGAMNADPIGDSYVAIIHPYAAYDLKTCKEFMEVHKYADPDTMFRGEIGKLGNIRFIETSEAKIWKDATCPAGLAVFGTLVLGAHAYGVTELEGGGLEHIVKQLGYGDDPLNQRASVGWKGMRAAERLVEQYMIRIEMCRAKRREFLGQRIRELRRSTMKIKLFKDNSRYKEDLFVSVNGVNYKIRRGVEVEVPPEVAEVLEHSQMQDERTAARIAAAENGVQ